MKRQLKTFSEFIRKPAMATFLSISIVTLSIVWIAIPLGHDLVWNAMFDVAMEQGAEQADKFSNYANKSIQQGTKPEAVINLFQEILDNAAYDSTQFVCIVDNEGKILAHPESSAVGSKVSASYLLHKEQPSKLMQAVSNSLIPSRSLVQYNQSKKIDLLYQHPLPELGSSIWVHTSNIKIEEKADKVMMALNAVILPALLLIIAISTYAVRKVGRSYESQLEKLAQTDGLTGLVNRRYFDERFSIEWKRAMREKHSIAIAMIDIDHFKTFNDNYGHPAGDEVIKQVATCFAERVRRATDIVARYGGEEFIIVLVNYPKDKAIELIRSLIESVAQLNIEHQYSSCAKRVTCSAGLASIQPDDALTPQRFISIADQALYSAKENGRNRLVSD